MSDKPTFSQRVAVESKTEHLQDYAAALGTIRAARGVFLLALVLSLLMSIGAYSAARWGKVLQPVSALSAEGAAPTSAPAMPAGGPALDEAYRFSVLYHALQLLMPLSEFVGQVSCALLTLCFFLAANVCLSGGLGGARGSVSAFFWMLMLLAVLFPWGRWLGEGSGLAQMPGVYCTFEELRTLPASFRDRVHEVLHYVRFLAYPALALCMLLVGDAKFGRAYKQVRGHLEARLS